MPNRRDHIPTYAESGDSSLVSESSLTNQLSINRLVECLFEPHLTQGKCFVP